MSDPLEHCVATVRAIVARKGSDRRSVLQLGYNLGRLSELTGLGRGPFWDRWKTAVEGWDQGVLDMLARELLDIPNWPRPPSDPNAGTPLSPGTREPTPGPGDVRPPDDPGPGAPDVPDRSDE